MEADPFLAVTVTANMYCAHYGNETCSLSYNLQKSHVEVGAILSPFYAQ